jgi:hypothetical protein
LAGTSIRNFTDAPLEKRLDTQAMMEKPRSAGNGLGDIYQIDLSELHLQIEKRKQNTAPSREP